MKKIFLYLLILLTVSSCTVNTKVVFSENTPLSGSSETEISATDFFSDLLEDLASFRREKGKSLMELGIDDFSDAIRSSSVSSNIKAAENNDSKQYCVSFDFSDFNVLLNELSMYKNQNVLAVNDNRLELNINIDNYHYLKEMIPFLAIEDIEVYGPEYNIDYSEDDYLTMMSFIAGERAAQGILSSVINIQITMPSDIIDTNGTVIDARTVSFEFGLIDFLLLHNPICFYCEF